MEVSRQVYGQVGDSVSIETRPWGRYVVLHSDKDTWLKRLIISPGQSLSLQTHENRDEFWYTTDIGVLYQKGDLVKPMISGVPVFCSRNQKHRLMNTSDHEVVVIEWAIGSPIESDIIRIEDNYGRS